MTSLNPLRPRRAGTASVIPPSAYASFEHRSLIRISAFSSIVAGETRGSRLLEIWSKAVSPVESV